MLLIVDDELDLCEILRFNLESEGFEVETACSAEQALEMIKHAKHPFELILLDVMMEKMSGYEMAKQLRDEGNEVPIIFLTALNTEENQLEGFGAGADDYITKPFSFQTVLARVKAVLKRARKTESDPASPNLTVGGITILPSEESVLVEGKVIQLTRKEYSILSLFTENPDHYFSREEIMDKVWDDDICVGERSVDVHIARLRKKLGNMGQYITNKTGFGYVLHSPKDEKS